MAYSSYNDVTVKIDGTTPFLVESASIDSNAYLDSDYSIYKKASLHFLPDGPLKGSVSLNYPIVGEDYLYQFINSEKSMALDIGGFIINSGYLASYSFEVSRFSPVKVSVEIDFWGPVRGSFSKRRETTPTLRSITSEDLTLFSNGINTANSLISLNYSFYSSLESDLLVGSSEPSSIKFLEREISLDLKSYDLAIFLPYTGIPADFDIGFIGNGGQTYKIRGTLMAKGHSFDFGQRTSYDFSFKQKKIGLPPTITDISYDTNSKVLTIDGSNLFAVYSIIYNPGGTSNYFISKDENRIKTSIPIGSRNGLITVVSPAGEASHYCGGIPSSLYAN